MSMGRGKKIVAGITTVGLAIPTVYAAYEFGPLAYEFVENSLDDLPRRSLPDEAVEIKNSLFVCFEGFDANTCDTSNSLMYASTGGNRIEKPFEHFDPKLIHAILAVEDPHFLDNLGPAEYLQKMKAFYENRGGSGIPEMAARISYVDAVPSGETEVCIPELGCRTVPKRKEWEWDMARTMQEQESPQETMEKVLNDAYLGCNSYGFEQAAQSIFHVSASYLTYEQAAYLAGLLRAPSSFDGVDSDGKGGEAENEQELVDATTRRNHVLHEMTKPMTWFDGTKVAITAEQAAAAQAQPRGFDRCTPPSTTPVPHYEVADAIGARHALNQIQVDLVRETGKDFMTYAHNNDGPVYVLSTINYDVQVALNSAVANSDFPRDGREAAVTAVTEGGAVAGLYGGPYSNENQVNLAIEPTLGGSSDKPYIYASAMEDGVISTDIDDPKQTPDEIFPLVWKQGNGDGTDWIIDEGAHCEDPDTCTVRKALAGSDNIIPAMIQMSRGPEGLIAVDQFFDSFGITSDSTPEPSMVLGSREASPVDRTTGQFQLLNEGKSVDRHYVNEVWQILSDKDNNIYCWKCNAQGQTELVELETSQAMLEALRGVINDPSGTAYNTLNNMGVAELTDTAGKTGTHFGNLTASFFGTFCVAKSKDMTIGVVIRFPNELKSLGDNFTGGGYPTQIWGSAVQSIKSLDGNKEYCEING